MPPTNNSFSVLTTTLLISLGTLGTYETVNSQLDYCNSVVLGDKLSIVDAGVEQLLPVTKCFKHRLQVMHGMAFCFGSDGTETENTTPYTLVVVLVDFTLKVMT